MGGVEDPVSQSRACRRPLNPGSVLGVDVGFSPTRRSSAICRLDWDARQITWTIRRFRALPAERQATILAVAGSARLEAAAFDGPLRQGLDIIGRYRTAERMLTKRLTKLIGKPGPANVPSGKALNEAANHCARNVGELCTAQPARHAVRIGDLALYESFPSSFLGLMLEDPAQVAARRGDRSDVFFQRLVADGTLERLLAHLLPHRSPAAQLANVTNHDDRAALICALGALSVAASDFTAVGEPTDGWIILPPHAFIRDWARVGARDLMHWGGRPGEVFRRASNHQQPALPKTQPPPIPHNEMVAHLDRHHRAAACTCFVISISSATAPGRRSDGCAPGSPPRARSASARRTTSRG